MVCFKEIICRYLFLLCFCSFLNISSSVKEARKPSTKLINKRSLNTENENSEVIQSPLDILFIVDQSQTSDVNLVGTKCILRKLTEKLDLGFYNKVRMALLNPKEVPSITFSFRRYYDAYGYLRAFEMLENTKSTRLYLGRSLSKALQRVIQPSASYGARYNIAKLIIAVIGSPSMDNISEEAIKLIASPYIATVAVGYGNASEKILEEISGDQLGVIYKQGSLSNICRLWRPLYKVILKRIDSLFSTPIKPLKEFHLYISGSTSIKIGWKRPTDIISYYIINYYPLNMGNDNFTDTLKVDIGQEGTISLNNLDTTVYKFEITAYGIKRKSSILTAVFDMSCSVVSSDILLLIDTSIVDQDSFTRLKEGFLKSFVQSFLIDQTKTRIGIILYANESRYVSPLSTYTDTDDILWRLNHIYFENGLRNTGFALNFAYFHGFEYVRRAVFKALVIVTDGMSEDDLMKPLQKLKNDQTLIVQININRHEKSNDQWTLHQFGDEIYSVTSYEELNSITLTLTTTICKKGMDYYQAANPQLLPPRNLMINDIRNTSLEVSWEIDESDLITGFEIIVINTGQAYSVGKHRRHLVLYNLLPGHFYNISVSTKGLGIDSTRIEISATTDILPPTLNRAIKLNQSKIEISWKYSSNDFVHFQLKIFERTTNELIESYLTNGTNKKYISEKTVPGTEYEICVTVIYIDGVRSSSKSLFITTDLPVPNQFKVDKIFETQVRVSWKKLMFQRHDTSKNLAYQVQVTDNVGNILAQKIISNNTLSSHCWIKNLAPGRELNATIQAHLGSVESKVYKIKFQTRQVQLSLDIAIFVEISPSLRDSEVIMTLDFLELIVNSFDHDTKGYTNFALVQLTNQPIEIISFKSSLNRNSVVSKLREMMPLNGASVLKDDQFEQIVLDTFKYSRSGVPRIMILLNTNQHFSNLMPESEDHFAKIGITSIVLQMSVQAEVPYSNHSIMHRYVLDTFEQLRLVVNYVTIDAIRAYEYLLKEVNREKALLPHSLAVFQDSAKNNIAEWWAPIEWPHYYQIQLNDENSVVWRKNITVRRIHYRLRLIESLKPNTLYNLILKAYSKDNFSACLAVNFKTDFNRKMLTIKRSLPIMNFWKSEKSTFLTNGQCCSRKNANHQSLRPRDIRYLSTVSKKAGSCVIAGSNLLFLIDDSNLTAAEDFVGIKSELKKLVNSLRIESVEKTVEAKKRQLSRRRTLNRTPELLVYGVGLSVIQFSDQPKVHLPLLTRMSTKQIFQSIDTLKQRGGSSCLNRALRFIENNIWKPKKTFTREVLILISSSKYKRRTLKRMEKIKKTGVRLITAELIKIQTKKTHHSNSARLFKYSFKLQNSSIFDHQDIFKTVKDAICQSTVITNKKVKRKSKSSKNNLSSSPSNCTNCVQESEKFQKTSGSMTALETTKLTSNNHNVK